MAERKSMPYSFLLSNPRLVSRLFDLVNGRGLVVNSSKNCITNSFRKPVFIEGKEDFRNFLMGLRGGPGGYPAIHVTHARYDRIPESFGESGSKRDFRFFLDIDGRSSLDSARRVTLSMVEELESLGVPHWVKFSGCRGFHIHVPWGPFPEVIDGESIIDLAPKLFLDIKHHLIRKAREGCPEALLDVIIHPEKYYRTTQGIQRLPFSLHEQTGKVSLPLHKEELENWPPKKIRKSSLESRFNIIEHDRGDIDQLISTLEGERTEPAPFFLRV